MRKQPFHGRRSVKYINAQKSAVSGGYNWLPTYSSTNQYSSIPGVTGPYYDSNGNVTWDGDHSYSWDADGNVVTVTPDSGGTTTRVFDAFDRQVEESWSNGNTQLLYQLEYGPTGKVAIMSGQTLFRSRVPAPGGGMIVYGPGPTLVRYMHPDWQGSIRVSSNTDQTIFTDEAYAPYGEQYAYTGIQSMFTGQWPGIQLDYYDFLYRELHPVQGRWLSPDPAGLAAVNPSNPQSWNRYAYVMNNPLALVDPQGLSPACLSARRAHRLSAPTAGCPGVYEGGSGGVVVDFGGGFPTGLFGDGGPAGGESAVQCPNNTCEGAFTNSAGVTQFYQYSAFAGAAEAVDGFYTTWGPGSLSFSVNQAGITASEWGAWYLEQTGSEAGGSIWCGYGICSTTISVGQPNEGGVYYPFDFSDIPGGTNGQGWWRSTGAEGTSSDLVLVDYANAALGTSLPQYSGTPTGGGRVLYYGPENGWVQCVLVGGVWPYGDAIRCH